jgi:hypothetical protein
VQPDRRISISDRLLAGLPKKAPGIDLGTAAVSIVMTDRMPLLGQKATRHQATGRRACSRR